MEPDPSTRPTEPERLLVRVIPRARRNEVAGERNGRLLVRVTAAPVDGKANEAVCEVVAAHLGVRAAAVTIAHGGRGRDKVLEIHR